MSQSPRIDFVLKKLPHGSMIRTKLDPFVISGLAEARTRTPEATPGSET